MRWIQWMLFISIGGAFATAVYSFRAKTLEVERLERALAELEPQREMLAPIVEQVREYESLLQTMEEKTALIEQFRDPEQNGALDFELIRKLSHSKPVAVRLTSLAAQDGRLEISGNTVGTAPLTEWDRILTGPDGSWSNFELRSSNTPSDQSSDGHFSFAVDLVHPGTKDP